MLASPLSLKARKGVLPYLIKMDHEEYIDGEVDVDDVAEEPRLEYNFPGLPKGRYTMISHYGH